MKTSGNFEDYYHKFRDIVTWMIIIGKEEMKWGMYGGGQISRHAVDCFAFLFC